MPAAPLAAPDVEDRSHHSAGAAAPAVAATPGSGGGGGSDDSLFAAVDIADDEPHPEGAVARAVAAAAAAAAGDASSPAPSPDDDQAPEAAASTARRRTADPAGHPPQPQPQPQPPQQRLPRRPWRQRLSAYFRKWRGGLDHPPPVPHLADLAWSFLGAFAAILAVSGLDAALWGLPPANPLYDARAPAALPADPSAHPLGALPVLVASFGATAVLVFGAPESKLSQPRGCVCGHVLSAAVGVLARLAFGEGGARAPPPVVAALGMSLALTAMQITSTTHPPGGATALIACTAPGAVSAGAWYGGRFVAAVAVGSAVMTSVGVVVNNLAGDRAYPTYWWWGTGARPRWCGSWRRVGAGAGGDKAGAGGGGGAGGAPAA